MRQKIGVGIGILAVLLLAFCIKNNMWSVFNILDENSGEYEDVWSDDGTKDETSILSGQQVDIILFMGQSNMSGAEGDVGFIPELTDGAGYEYRAITNPDRLYVLEEPFGVDENKEGFLDDRYILSRNGTMVTAFVNAYYAETGVPVVAISASRGSSPIALWLDHLFIDAQDRLKSCESYLTSNGIDIRHCYMVWMQGEADANMKTGKEDYITSMKQLMDQMESVGVEKCFLIQIGNYLEQPEHHNLIQEAQIELCQQDDRIFLVSTIAAELDEYLDTAGIHFYQEGLNLIGTDAGRMAGLEAKDK